VLGVISTSLIVTSGCLIWNMHAYFEKEMKKDACRITAVSIIFPLTYVARAVSYVYLPTGLISTGITGGWIFETSFALYLVWDILPLSLVMLNHYQVFTEFDQDQKDRVATADLMKSTHTSDDQDFLLRPQSLKFTDRNSLDSISNVYEVYYVEPQFERADLNARDFHSMVLFDDSVYTKTLRENARLMVQRMSESL